MRVTIHFFRHGESVANVVQHEQCCGSVSHLFIHDPVLTTKGENESHTAGACAPDVDVVLSSELLRAIQTALRTYPTRFVTVVPYLNELGGGMDNLPKSDIVQNEILGKHRHRLIRPSHKQEHSFIQYLKTNILPLHNGKECLTIALFTHSRLMRKYLGIPVKQLPNNYMVTREFTI